MTDEKRFIEDGEGAGGEPAPVPGFRSILFPPGLETQRVETTIQPDCFIDLNLDQVVAGIVTGRDEAALRPLFHATYRSEEIVRHRQAVFADLERPEIFAALPPFSSDMRRISEGVAYAGTVARPAHRHMAILHAIDLYCTAVRSLRRDLQPLTLKSAGLDGLRHYLAGYVAADGFAALAAETEDLQRALSEVAYGMLFRSDRVTIRKYAGEPDYAATIRERFARFAAPHSEAAEQPATSTPELNTTEQDILEFVSRLFPEPFRRLEDYVSRHAAAFVDPVVADFGREIDFFVTYLEFIQPLKDAGLAFCYPDISAVSKATEVVDGFDLALAAQLVRQDETVVPNDFELARSERIIVVSGPNQGGKTTFALMFGQAHYLAGLGCPVPGTSARLFLADRVFTHFEHEEDIANLRGKLEDELVRLRQASDAMTADSVVILNEMFNSTSLDDQVFLSTKVLEQILALDAIAVCVTFIEELSRLSGKTVSMVSTVDPEDPARRTFKVVRKPADGFAYARSLAERHGLTYDKLRARLRP
jgi:hypothetical protein